MKMEYTAEIIRGWPADGALERVELVKQGSVLSNGDVVAMQPDGTVALCASSATNKVGLVVRGNGDSAAAANANGFFMTPQTAQAITATWSAGVVTVTFVSSTAFPGLVVGNVVTINAGAGSSTYTNYIGDQVVTGVSGNTFTFAHANNDGTITANAASTATLKTATNTSGKAVVLWGNYIVRTINYTGSAFAPGDGITAASGKWVKDAGSDPLVGFVLSFGDYTRKDQGPGINTKTPLTILVR